MMRPGDPSSLRPRLDALAQRARRHLGTWQRARDLRRSARRASVWAPVGPLFAGVYQLSRVLMGDGGDPWSAWVWIGLLLLGPIVALVVGLVQTARRRHLSRRECLGAYDLQLSTHDRLVIADEFLAAPVSADGVTASFTQAAIEDAADHIATAEQAILASRPLPTWALTRQAVAFIGVAVLLVMATIWLTTSTATPTDRKADAEVAHAGPAAMPVRMLQEWFGRAPARPRPSRPSSDTPDAVSNTQAEPDASPRSDQTAQDAAGGSQSGGQARSRSTSQAMSSAGSPSNQQNPSQPLEDDPPQDQPTSTPNPPKPTDGRKGEAQSSSATSGQGQSRSSSVDRSAIPAADQPDRAGANKDDGKDEEGAEDEVEEEKTSGAERPSLRRNKPPVDRNLSSRPAGDEPDPNANGRSGPGGRKKTRGVPAMILGIPTPDRIQGMTNPGRSKVTQENATPREEPQAAVDAEARGPRQAPMGHIEHPRLTPWMQSLIEKYFTREKPPVTAGSGG